MAVAFRMNAVTSAIQQAVLMILTEVWTPTCDVGSTERSGAWIAEITDMLGLLRLAHGAHG
jgi:hypothetical protein